MLRGFIEHTTKPGAMVYMDEAAACERLLEHAACSYSVGKFVEGMAYTNGMESCRDLMKRGALE